MDTLLIELAAALIDNPATPDHRTRVEITLENAANNLEIENLDASPRSVHKFTIKNPTRFGYRGPQNLSVDQIAILLAISCSLANPRILFSPLQPYLLATSVKYDEIPTKIEMINRPGELNIAVTDVIRITEHISTVMTTKLGLDEVTLLNIVDKFLAHRIFDTTNRTIIEINVIEAIKRYRDALMAAEGVSCYSLLYKAFEKAINADIDREGKDFDKAASLATGLSEAEIEELRKFDNRIKHALRNHADLATLKAGEARLGELSRSLKKAADKAIISRV